ncbi:MAG: hypothetical protein CMJ27_02040 [Phycisphaerae bacterium]|nr:hypothetical protein [Phycisphaerae bacterium]
MKRQLLIAARLLLVAIGVTVIALLVEWRTVAVIPAGSPGPDERIVDAPTAFAVTDTTPLGDGLVRAGFEGGDTAVVPAEWIRPGLLALLGDADPAWLAIAIAIAGFIYPLQTTRWWMLMRCRGIDATWRETLRLVMAGALCNFLLPGTEGGDVVKAWGVAAGSGRRIEAVMSVVVDRITGLLGLVLLAAIAGITADAAGMGTELGRWAGWTMFLLAITVALLFLVAGRGWIRIPDRLDRFGRGLPGRVVEAATAYAGHPRTVASATLLSLLVQTMLALVAGCGARSLGAPIELAVILVAMPLIFLAAAIPITWQGAGVMELAAIGILVGDGGATVNQIVGMLLLYRGIEFAWSLLGAVPVLRGGIRIHPDRMQGTADAEV